MFCWPEVSAKYVGILQSLLITCRLHGINPYDYFVDVLQRIDRHPAAKVRLLTPRLWKRHYSANPCAPHCTPCAVEQLRSLVTAYFASAAISTATPIAAPVTSGGYHECVSLAPGWSSASIHSRSAVAVG